MDPIVDSPVLLNARATPKGVLEVLQHYPYHPIYIGCELMDVYVHCYRHSVIKGLQGLLESAPNKELQVIVSGEIVIQ